MSYQLKLVTISVNVLLLGLCVLSVAFAASLPKAIVDVSGRENNILEGDDTFNVETWRPTPELSKNFPYYLSGYDDEDRMIGVIEFGKWDIVSYIHKGPKEFRELDRHAQRMVYILESSIWSKFPEPTNTTADATAKPVTNEVIMIIDMDDFKISQARNPTAVGFLIKYAGILERLQDRVHSAYFVNVNPVAGIVIRILKPNLGKVFERVEVYGTLRSQWMRILRRNLPEDQISEKYGGLPSHKPLIYVG